MANAGVNVEAIAPFVGAKFYNSADNCELSFSTGDRFVMTHIDEQAGWGKGRFNDSHGWFPLAFVRLIQTEDLNASAIEAKRMFSKNNCFFPSPLAMGLCDWCFLTL